MTVSGERRHTLTQEAYLAIKRRIIRLDLPPGAAFTESQLAADLALSKTPVREALTRLQREEFVEVNPRSGYSVSAVTLKDTRDLFALRILLEGEAARLAASSSSTPHMSQLRLLEKTAQIGYDPRAPESIARFLETNTEFHATIARASENRRLSQALQQVLDQMERLFHLGLPHTASSDDNVREHQELVKAIVRGDSELAHQLAISHVRASQSMVIDALLCSDALLSTNVAATPYALAPVATLAPGNGA